MASDNVELVRRAFEDFNLDGAEALLPHLHEDFVAITPPELASEPDTYRGHEGVRRYFESFSEAMDEIRIDPTELHGAGDMVIVEFVLRARGKSTGLEAEQPAVMNVRVADGSILEIALYPTLEAAQAALGRSA